MEYNVVLVRYSEIAVKGGYTRSRMERLLLRALQESLAAAGVDALWRGSRVGLL